MSPRLKSETQTFSTGCFMNILKKDSDVQSTPDNSNLQGKSKKVGFLISGVRVIGSSKKIAGSKEKKTVFTGR